MTRFALINHWRLSLALLFFSCALTGFLSGVHVTERNLDDISILTMMYYSLGLFILGGMDLGVPVDGPAWGRALLWFAYFASPALAGSTVFDWVQQLVSQQNRRLRALNNHIIVVGTNDLAQSLLRKVAGYNPDSQLLVVDTELNPVAVQEFSSLYGALVLEGDYTNDYFLTTASVERAQRVIIATDNDFANFECASKIIEHQPALAGRVLVHCNRLRFLREVQHSHVARNCITFNRYHLAAVHLVKTQMMHHFRATAALDTVVLAGFGRFGQTILEELQKSAAGEVSDVGIIDVDAQRRILVAREQTDISEHFDLKIVEGDIGHPEVWQRMESLVDLNAETPLVLIATGNDDENLRTGLWLRKQHPNVVVMVRSAQASHFAEGVAATAGIHTFGVAEVIFESMPEDWFH